MSDSENTPEVVSIKPYTLTIDDKKRTITYEGGEVRQPLTVTYPTKKGVRVIRGHALNGNLQYIRDVIVKVRIMKMKQNPEDADKPLRKVKEKKPKVK